MMKKEIVIKIRSQLAPLFNGAVTANKAAMVKVPRGYVNGEWYDGKTIFVTYANGHIEAGYYAADYDFEISYYPVGNSLNAVTDYLISHCSPILSQVKGELKVSFYNTEDVDEDCPWDVAV